MGKIQSNLFRINTISSESTTNNTDSELIHKNCNVVYRMLTLGILNELTVGSSGSSSFLKVTRKIHGQSVCKSGKRSKADPVTLEHGVKRKPWSGSSANRNTGSMR